MITNIKKKTKQDIKQGISTNSLGKKKVYHDEKIPQTG